MPDTLWPHGLYPARLLFPWDFPSKSTGVVCHFFPQGIFQEIQVWSLTDPGIKPASPTLAGGFFTAETQGIPHLDANVKQTACLFWKFPRPEFLSCNSIHCIARCHLAVSASTSGNKGLTNGWKKKQHTSKYSIHSYCCQ